MESDKNFKVDQKEFNLQCRT